MQNAVPNSSDIKQRLITEITNLKRKTALMQFCHGELATAYASYDKTHSICVALLAGLAAIITSAESRLILFEVEEGVLSGIAALITLVLFFVTLLRYEMQLSAKAGEHSSSLKSYTRFLRRLDMTLETLENKKTSEIEQISKDLANDYSDISDASPKIPSRQFIKLKQKHLQNIAVSRKLDTNPFLSIKQIRKQFKQEAESKSSKTLS
jgi:hypothetical protein